MSLVEHAKEVVRKKISTNVELVLKLAKKLELDPSSIGELLALSRLYPEEEASEFVRSLP